MEVISIPINETKCKRCGKKKEVIKAGKHITAKGMMQKFFCKSCHYFFVG